METSSAGREIEPTAGWQLPIEGSATRNRCFLTQLHTHIHGVAFASGRWWVLVNTGSGIFAELTSKNLYFTHSGPDFMQAHVVLDPTFSHIILNGLWPN